MNYINDTLDKLPVDVSTVIPFFAAAVLGLGISYLPEVSERLTEVPSERNEIVIEIDKTL